MFDSAVASGHRLECVRLSQLRVSVAGMAKAMTGGAAWQCAHYLIDCAFGDHELCCQKQSETIMTDSFTTRPSVLIRPMETKIDIPVVKENVICQPLYPRIVLYLLHLALQLVLCFPAID